LAGLWEFPNDLESENPHWTPFAQEGKGTGGEAAATAVHRFTHIEWHMRAYCVFPKTDALPEGWIWADETALRREIALPSAFAPFEELVRTHLRETAHER
jgi:A/G-specific adenine glycosylase